MNEESLPRRCSESAALTWRVTRCFESNLPVGICSCCFSLHASPSETTIHIHSTHKSKLNSSPHYIHDLKFNESIHLQVVILTIKRLPVVHLRWRWCYRADSGKQETLYVVAS
ncbi:hypothetical protein N665_0371s0004 [Sinapis alba]|nr:hypothetical protein N665_0371s0004 [Sinapis alba]